MVRLNHLQILSKILAKYPDVVIQATDQADHIIVKYRSQYYNNFQLKLSQAGSISWPRAAVLTWEFGGLASLLVDDGTSPGDKAKGDQLIDHQMHCSCDRRVEFSQLEDFAQDLIKVMQTYILAPPRLETLPGFNIQAMTGLAV